MAEGVAIERGGGRRKFAWLLLFPVLLLLICAAVFIPPVRNHIALAKRMYADIAGGGGESAAYKSGYAQPLTPEQKFAKDAMDEIAAVRNSVNDGAVTTKELGNFGDGACNAMTANLSAGYGVSDSYENGAVFWVDGLPATDLAFPSSSILSDGETFVSMAFKDICPRYIRDIPYGDPGGS